MKRKKKAICPTCNNFCYEEDRNDAHFYMKCKKGHRSVFRRILAPIDSK